jgi:hypothetical protein
MAKKAKTPRPPVQAPKRRDAKPRSTGSGGMPRWLLIVAALVAAGAVVGVVLAMSGGGDEDQTADVQAAMQAADCTVREVAPLPPKDGANFHADSPGENTKVEWSTDPPSGGGHYGLWAVWRFYRSPISPNKIVHNLEHGGVAIWWGPRVPRATVDELEAFYRDSPTGVVGTPYAPLGDKIALTAWTGEPETYYRDGDYGMGHIAVCSRYDEEAFKAFRDAFREKGPERGTNNEPGSGP